MSTKLTLAADLDLYSLCSFRPGYLPHAFCGSDTVGTSMQLLLTYPAMAHCLTTCLPVMAITMPSQYLSLAIPPPVPTTGLLPFMVTCCAHTTHQPDTYLRDMPSPPCTTAQHPPASPKCPSCPRRTSSILAVTVSPSPSLCVSAYSWLILS